MPTMAGSQEEVQLRRCRPTAFQMAPLTMDIGRGRARRPKSSHVWRRLRIPSARIGAMSATTIATAMTKTCGCPPRIMSTSPIEQPRPAVFLPCGAIGASGGPPARSPMNGGSLPVGSPTGDASTRAIYSGSPTFMGPPMTPMTPVDPSLRPAQWPDASPVYQPCAWPWPPAGVQPQPGMAPMAPMAPAGVAPMMAPPTWPQEPQWNPGSMPAWQGCQGVQQGPPGTYMVMGDGMAGYVANMEA